MRKKYHASSLQFISFGMRKIGYKEMKELHNGGGRQKRNIFFGGGGGINSFFQTTPSSEGWGVSSRS